MFKNFILIALRNLRRHSTYSIINISGLSIGIACSILILLWVNDETSYDKFIPKSEKLYQVYTNAEFDGDIVSWRSVPMPTYDEMKVADSHIVNSAVTGWGGERLMTVGDVREMIRQLYEFQIMGGNQPGAVLTDQMLDVGPAADQPFAIVGALENFVN